MTTRRQLLSLACGGALASISAGFPLPVRAQTSHSVVRLLVGFNAGGAIDVIARTLADAMMAHTVTQTSSLGHSNG